jgi:hypothetical protein
VRPKRRRSAGWLSCAVPLGSVQSLRLKYKNKVNFRGGFAVIQTSGLRSEKAVADARYGPPKEHDFVAILPLDVFFSFFADPAELADILTSKVGILMNTWMEKNGSPTMVGKRRPNSLSYDLDSHVWKVNNKGAKEERSTYCLSFSTYNFTVQNQEIPKPKIRLCDVKVRQQTDELVYHNHSF